MKKKSIVFWLCWIALFFIIEIPAIKDPASGDTLSELVWYIESYPLAAWLFVGFFSWLAVHFISKAKFK